MQKILFVCHGNICRSPMAEFVMKKLVSDAGLDNEFYIESAATSTEEIGNDMHHGTKSVLRKHDIPFERRAARQITSADYNRFDHIIIMDRYNRSNLSRIIRSDPDGKINMLLDFTERGGDIADPWYTGNFDETYSDVLEGCTALLEKLR